MPGLRGLLDREIHLNDDQKYFFDINGYLVIEAALARRKKKAVAEGDTAAAEQAQAMTDAFHETPEEREAREKAEAEAQALGQERERKEAEASPKSGARTELVQKRIMGLMAAEGADRESLAAAIDWGAELAAFAELDYPEYYRQPFRALSPASGLPVSSA